MHHKKNESSASKRIQADKARGYCQSHVDPKAYRKFKTPSFVELASEIEQKENDHNGEV